MDLILFLPIVSFWPISQQKRLFFHFAYDSVCLWLLRIHYVKNIMKQECIPVGCVPSVAVAIFWGLPQCMLGYTPPAWAWTSLQACAWRPPPQPDPPNLSPGCGPGDPPSQTPQPPPGYGPGDLPWPDPPTSPLGMGLETPLWTEWQTCVKT